MKCPHCDTRVNFEMDGTLPCKGKDFEQTNMGYELEYGDCPECGDLIVLLRQGAYREVHNSDGTTSRYLDEMRSEEFLYPKFVVRKVDSEVPERYRKDFLEASSVLTLSPKASAAISRRILQDILREVFKVKHSDLAKEIDEFIQRQDIPSYLTQAIDAVRNIGNFAAHPLKDTNTGQVVDVEPGEAEWLLDVLDSLFDFAFVQPKRLERRRKSLNEKLKALKKPPMKG